MKLHYITALAITGAAAATVALAPIASADVSVNQTPGNAQVVATPGAASQEAADAQMPFAGDEGALLFHHR
jgi:hypothetical protein